MSWSSIPSGMIWEYGIEIRRKAYIIHMGVSLNGGTQQPLVFLLKMIILGCFGGTTI